MPTNQQKRHLVLGSAAAIALAAGAGIGWQQSRSSHQETAAARLLFDWQLPCINSATNSVRTTADLKGKLVLVNFWATWCAPCIKEMPELDQLRTELSADLGLGASQAKFEFAGIGIDNEANIRQFLAKSPIRYPLFAAAAGGAELAKSFGNSNGLLPFTALVTSSDQVIWRRLGVLNIEETRRQIRQML